MNAFDRALIAEACTTSGLLWLDYDGAGRARPMRHVWHDGAAYVLAGGTEQPAPGLPELAASRHGAPAVLVSCRAKDSRALLVRWRAAVETVRPYTPEWDLVVPLFRAVRLNAPDSAKQGGDVSYVWANASVMVKLTPLEVVNRPDDPPTSGGYAEPPDSPATTRGRLPWVVHRRPVRRPRLS